ncbi:NADH-quinone oxidoreductase subunit K [Phenylobacterium sp.]|uniref:NADH-quinone oxidoreductase subunit K n=1 Tax=Phenylobacterium sp. TaxID=1871053 RepID=UPI002731B7AE|nr:NADH-quinone oxidoreductase subunit K [Phenylobacterium sp.]MDP2212872.1 NADH-quinone oxidoreductase subunit K [Phenylobacterium sp.]
MISTTAFGLTGAVLVALGLYGFVARRHLLRRLLAFNLVGSGLFLMFGALARRAEDGGSDPAPQAMIITGIVVALSATALAVTLIVRLHERTGATGLPDVEDEAGG